MYDSEGRGLVSAASLLIPFFSKSDEIALKVQLETLIGRMF
jgi:hypothetical protein